MTINFSTLTYYSKVTNILRGKGVKVKRFCVPPVILIWVYNITHHEAKSLAFSYAQISQPINYSVKKGYTSAVGSVG